MDDLVFISSHDTISSTAVIHRLWRSGAGDAISRSLPLRGHALPTILLKSKIPRDNKAHNFICLLTGTQCSPCFSVSITV